MRRLTRETPQGSDVPQNFEAHATFYTRHANQLDNTVLSRAVPVRRDIARDRRVEGLDALLSRLGPKHPVWHRNVTPPWLARAEGGWMVLKVLIPGLQPEHGNHYLPQLGGPLWAPRTWHDWTSTLPHPFG